MAKYFSFARRKSDWIMTPNNLPPSKAGIGKRLKIPKAKEIRARNWTN
jgi:hypothetical protein